MMEAQEYDLLIANLWQYAEILKPLSLLLELRSLESIGPWYLELTSWRSL